MCAKCFYLKHSLYLNPDTRDCRRSPPPLAWLPATRHGCVCFPPALPCTSPRCLLFTFSFTLGPAYPWWPLSHSSHQPWPLPVSFLQLPRACTAPTLRGPLGSTPAQALGNEAATAAATNPFIRFLPCYHIKMAAPALLQARQTQDMFPAQK